MFGSRVVGVGVVMVWLLCFDVFLYDCCLRCGFAWLVVLL